MTQVPQPGQTFCHPPFSQWRELAATQYGAIYPFDALRKSWRGEVAYIAARYTASLGLSVPEIGTATPLVMSGHQPNLYHPGVIYKYRLLARMAEQGFSAINLNVDTDVCEGFPVKLPAYNGGYHKVAHYLSPHAVKSFYCDVATDRAALEIFAQNAVCDLEGVPGNIFGSGVDFLRNEFSRELPEKLADATVSLRRRYAKDWPGNVLEAPLSEICKTAQFFDFAFSLLQRGMELAGIFNASLERYRLEHKLRYPANPFPNLAQGPAGVETLFWLVKGDARATLAVAESGNGIRLAGEEAEIKDGAGLMAFFIERGYRLWPKAVTLSVINRLYLSDLFIHGIGGAKYDRITDEVIEGFYGLTPPVFAVASATLAVEGLDDPLAHLMELKQKMRETDFHPEQYLENPPRDLLELKEKLLEQIKIPGADKKMIGKNLSEINEKLKLLLAPFKAALSAQIAEAEKDLHRRQTLADRELPFFLYPPTAIP